VTDVDQRARASAMSAAPELVRVSVVAARTQLDLAVPVDVPVANLVPELVKLVASRDAKTPADAPAADTAATCRVLARLDTAIPLESNETLRTAGVLDGDMLHLPAQQVLSALTLYDDVVDAAARLNKAAYIGWNGAAARWMSFAGLSVTSLIWVYLLLAARPGEERTTIMGLAAAVVATMVGLAALAHRSYAQADIGAAIGWSTIPISAAMAATLVAGLGGYGLAAASVCLAVFNLVSYQAIGSGRWGYLASSVFFLAGGLAVLSHAAGLPTPTAAAAFAVAAALTCLTIPRLTGKPARCEQSTANPDANPDTAILAHPNPREPKSAHPRAISHSAATVPTAEAVWGQTRSAKITRSALYTCLGLSAYCAAAIVLHDGQHLHWAGLVFAWVCALALALHARVPDSAAERVPLAAAAVALAALGCISTRGGTAAMASTGLGALLAIAVLASATGVAATAGHLPRRSASALQYLQYAAFAALIPAAWWAAGVYAALDVR
jgi:type VII secretion integral membrane protein EccD